MEKTTSTIGKPEDIPLSVYGNIVCQRICDILKYYPVISVDHFVIMPNHIHLLPQINTDHDGRPLAAPTISFVLLMLSVGTMVPDVAAFVSIAVPSAILFVTNLSA